MTLSTRLACVAAFAWLAGCASAPLPLRHLTLDDSQPRLAQRLSAPSIAVVRADLPDRIDRVQLVLLDGNQVTFSEQYRWAEPLRREIPRVVANDLAEFLDSSRVAALPVDAAGYDVDFKLRLDFQRLDAVRGQGAQVDVLWRLEPRSGKAVVGRSSVQQALTDGATDVPALVAAQRQALRRVAADIAQAIGAYPGH